MNRSYFLSCLCRTQRTGWPGVWWEWLWQWWLDLHHSRERPQKAAERSQSNRRRGRWPHLTVESSQRFFAQYATWFPMLPQEPNKRPLSQSLSTVITPVLTEVGSDINHCHSWSVKTKISHLCLETQAYLYRSNPNRVWKRFQDTKVFILFFSHSLFWLLFPFFTKVHSLWYLWLCH